MKAIIFSAIFLGLASLAYADYPNNCANISQNEYTLVGSTVPTKIMSQSNVRRCAYITNKGASTIYISISSQAPATTGGRPVLAAANWDQSNALTSEAWANAIIGTTSAVIVIEGK